MRLNRHNTFRNFEARFTGWCFNDNGAPSSGGGAPTSGGDPGGGGGGSGASTTPPNGGGQVQENAVHSFGNPSPPSQDHATRVSGLLAKGPEEHLSFDDIHALISFDAPLKPAASPAPAAQPNAATTTPVAPTTPAPAALAVPTISPDAKAIIEAVRQMQAPNPAAPTNPTPDPAPEAPRPYYGGEVQALQVSPQIMTALVGSEDPAILAQAAPAVNALVNGIMNRARQDTIAHVQNMLSAALSTHVPQTVQQLQQVNQLETKFYGTFKHLDKPAIRPVVAQLSNLYAQAQRKTDPNFTWTDEHFKTVAALTARHFERQGFSIAGAGPITTNAPQAPTNPTQPVAQPTPQQPYMSSGGTRPPVVSTPTNQSADLVAFVM